MILIIIKLVGIVYTLGIAFSVFFASMEDEDAFTEAPWYANTGFHVFCLLAVLYSILS